MTYMPAIAPSRLEIDAARERTMGAAQRIARHHRAAGGLAHGGSPAQSSAPAQFGLVDSTVPGRTDRHNMDLPSGSYVLPADVVSGLGEGNSLAGAAVVDKMFHSSPYGIQPVQPGKGVLPTRDRVFGTLAPRVQQQTEGERTLERQDAKDNTDTGMARGGANDSHVPVVVAGGEYILHPDTIAYHRDWGGLDRNNADPRAHKMALDRAHAKLDAFVKKRRAMDIKTLSRLPGPQK